MLVKVKYGIRHRLHIIEQARSYAANVSVWLVITESISISHYTGESMYSGEIHRLPKNWMAELRLPIDIDALRMRSPTGRRWIPIPAVADFRTKKS